MVDLVEDHQCPAVLGAHAVPVWVRGDLRVGEDDTVIVGAGLAGRVAEPRIEGDPDAGGGLGPLMLEVLGGCDNGDRLDGLVVEQFAGDPQTKGRLARAGGGDGQEVGGFGRQILGEGASLPGAEPDP